MDRDFFTSPTGQVVLVAAVLLLGVLAVHWQKKTEAAPALPVAKSAPAEVLPKTLTRDGQRFSPPSAKPTEVVSTDKTIVPTDQTEEFPAQIAPLALFAAKQLAPPVPPIRPAPTAPYGRLIPCETVLALESNRLDTPIVGLVTEDVWHNGQLVIPAGAEVHGRASLDRFRERIASQGTWWIVWRTTDADNGTELSVSGLVLDRDYNPATHQWGEHDGSAGLRGQVIKTDNERELKLFAATFLATATSALQNNRVTAGLLAETSVPAATASNAVLASTGAVLRDYARELREAIALDGFYLRVPAGKAFYLYVTQTLDRAQGQPGYATPLVSSSPAL